MSNRRLRILHVVSTIDARAGGPAVAVVGLATAQQRVGLDVSMLATATAGESDDAAKALRANGVNVEIVGPCTMPLCRHRQIVPTLQRLMPQADLVHIHALWEEVQFQAAKLARQLGKPYVISAHGMLDPWSLAQSKWKKKLYLMLRMRRYLDGAAAIHFTSKSESDGAKPLGLKSPHLVEPLGVDLSEFAKLPPRGSFRARYPQLQDRPIVMYLGRIYPQKGLELLVPALARGNVDRAMLVVVGPDQDGFQAQVERLADEHGVRDRIVFTGILRGQSRNEALVDADLFALPSFHENFGMAIVEALACGVPVIVSDQVGICHEIAEGRVGAVVPTQIDPQAQTMRTWLTDDTLRHDAAARTRPFVEKTYDLLQVAARWKQHYQGLIHA
jgi:glycosyltransferase involved in cell wall biosynthesis